MLYIARSVQIWKYSS